MPGHISSEIAPPSAMHISTPRSTPQTRKWYLFRAETRTPESEHNFIRGPLNNASHATFGLFFWPSFSICPATKTLYGFAPEAPYGGGCGPLADAINAPGTSGLACATATPTGPCFWLTNAYLGFRTDSGLLGLVLACAGSFKQNPYDTLESP